MQKLTILILVFLLPCRSTAQKGEILIYDPGYRLCWNDFLGQPDISENSKGAQISTTLQLKSVKVDFWTGKAKFKALAVMEKENSWVRSNFKNDYVLAHEQVHFDIAYLIARKMEDDINKLRVSISNKKLINSLFDNWHSIFILEQKTYDLMTNGGNNARMQHFYEKKIENALKALH